MPVKLAAHRVVCPVRTLSIHEDDPRIGVAGILVAPYVVVTVWPVRISPGFLKPGVLIRGVVHHQVGDHPDAPLVRLVQQHHEILNGAELGQHRAIVGDVVTAVAQRGGVERRQPQAVDAQPLQIVQLLRQAGQVAGAVAIRVVKSPYEYLIKNGMFVPIRVSRRGFGVFEVLGLRFDQVAVGPHCLTGVWDSFQVGGRLMIEGLGAEIVRRHQDATFVTVGRAAAWAGRNASMRRPCTQVSVVPVRRRERKTATVRWNPVGGPEGVRWG